MRYLKKITSKSFDDYSQKYLQAVWDTWYQLEQIIAEDEN